MFAPFRLGVQTPPASVGRNVSDGRDRPPTSRRLTPCLGAMNSFRGCPRARAAAGCWTGLIRRCRPKAQLRSAQFLPAKLPVRNNVARQGPRLRLSSVVRAGTSSRGQPADPAGPHEARRPQAGAELAAQDPRAANSISDCKTQRVRLMIFGQAAARQTVQSRKSVQRLLSTQHSAASKALAPGFDQRHPV